MDPTQLCYDIGFVGLQTEAPGSRPSRGCPHDLQDHIKDAIALSAHKYTHSDQLADAWSNENYHIFDDAQPFNSHGIWSNDNPLRTWTNDEEFIKDKIRALFSGLTPRKPRLSNAELYSGGFKQPEHDRIDSQEITTDAYPRKMTDIKVASTAGPIQRLERKEPKLMDALQQSGFSGCLPRVFPSRKSLIQATRRSMEEMKLDSPPGSIELRPAKIKATQEKEYKTRLVLATTNEEVVALQLSFSGTSGGWAIFEKSDLDMTGRCIYAITSRGNCQTRRGYHGWRGDGLNFSLDAIAHNEGDSNFRPKQLKSNCPDGYYSTTKSDTKASAGSNINNQPANRSEKSSDQESRGHRQRQGTSQLGIQSDSVDFEWGPSPSTPRLFNTKVQLPSHTSPAPSLANPDHLHRDVAQGSLKRRYSTVSLRPQNESDDSTSDRYSRQAQRKKGSEASRGSNFRTQEPSPKRHSVRANVGSSSNTYRALGTMVNNNLQAVTTGNSLDSYNLQCLASLAKCIEQLEKLSPLANQYAKLAKRGLWPDHQESIETVQDSISVQEDAKEVYDQIMNKREALISTDSSIVTERIFTHDEDLTNTPPSLTEWAFSAKSAPDLVDWALYTNAGLNVNSSRQPDT
ncbi:uncharacterized protein KY384_008576 [Bacidia gigantensis]|uniref:uncharacterized protein n=1 Tax=Bacidia gigantensis TaxID=2732470 RepID=UPI001D036EC5|nr:uncharacterized protein KY384_008576 [Bacidia gigantensis]KAG8527146.1 hypothetical protein KY384_008576 [Bacidia gigantensis]